jgi:hypothetical protein
MESILDVLKKYYIGKVYDLYVYTDPRGITAEYLSDILLPIPNSIFTPIQVTVKDVELDVELYFDCFVLTFIDSDKRFSLKYHNTHIKF